MGVRRLPSDHNIRGKEFSGFRAFTEFFGPNSFAGLHKPDDPKRLVLFYGHL
jgi:hypothetical protein